MTQEEKGKAYDELKVKAQELTEDGYIDKLALLDLFPELKEESEDEKIRKALLELVHDTTGDELWVDYNVHKEDALAWLEKQGTSYTKRDVDDAYVEGMAFAKNELEKQGEQKPADKVEPKFKVKYAGNEYNVLDIKENMGITWYGIEDEPNHIDYVKANSCEIINVYGIKENGSPYPTKPAIFAGHNPSDEDMKEALRTEYEKGRADAFAQMQKEWSEEDEKIRQNLMSLLSDMRRHRIEESTYQKYYPWLKSLKDKYTWKPSIAQLNALSIVSKGNAPDDIEAIVSLYNDLKKLTE